MPGTPHELAALAIRHAERREQEPQPDHVWNDGSEITPAEFRDVVALIVYVRGTIYPKRDARAQRRAMKLLRPLLTAEQKKSLRREKSFLACGSKGGMYRLCPGTGSVQGVAWHRSRWFSRVTFCLHDNREGPEAPMPPADVTLTHLLLLKADEELFLHLANARQSDLWNGDYLRRMRHRRRDQAETPP